MAEPFLRPMRRIHCLERVTATGFMNTLDFPNAVWRLHQVSAAWTRCLLLAFRYTAVSDEKREGPVWLGTLAGRCRRKGGK